MRLTHCPGQAMSLQQFAVYTRNANQAGHLAPVWRLASSRRGTPGPITKKGFAIHTTKPNLRPQLPLSKIIQRYLHQPLLEPRQIRVLELAPATQLQDPISCRLVELSLPADAATAAATGATLDYEALSYVWGSPTGDRAIRCEGGVLLVTENCEAALRNLRYAHGPRRLWIDSVCIDQTSDEEKSQQVPLMGDIYRLARRTVVWLGEGDERGIAGMRYLRIMSWIPGRWLKAVFAGSWNGKLHCEKRACIGSLRENPWFERMWTLQEIIFSNNPVVALGRQSVAWDPFFWGLLSHSGLRTDDDGLRLFIRHLFRGLRQARRTPELKRRLMLCVVLSRLHRASLPHDMIYGLYNVLTSAGIELSKPDYTKSLADLFGEVTVSLIRGLRSYSILNHLPSAHRLKELPSWVPDLSQRSEFFQNVALDDGYNATPNSGTLIKSASSRRLVVMGKRVDTVRVCSSSYYQRHETSEARKFDTTKLYDSPLFETRLKDPEMRMAIKSYLRQIAVLRDWVLLALRRADAPQEVVIQQLVRVFVCRPYMRIGLGGGRRNPEATLHKWIELLLSPERFLDGRKSEEWRAAWQLGSAPEESALIYLRYAGTWEDAWWRKLLALHTEMHVVCTAYSFFISTAGRMGFGYHKMETGDSLVLLAGGYTPYILRPCGNDQFQFVGPAYVYGVMDGEEWRDGMSVKGLESFTLV